MTRAVRTLLIILLLAPPLVAGELIAKRAALSTVDSRATAVGIDVLRRGGNAIDAAVAVSFALAVVHPQAGNIGGGGFLVYYEKATGAVWTLDFRETAPRAASAKMYVSSDPAKKLSSETGALAVAVPGSVAGMNAAHERFGSIAWSELLGPSIRLADEGFVTRERFTKILREEQEKRQLDQIETTGAMFYPNGKPLPAGTLLVQKELAKTLGRIAQRGSSEFYRGGTGKRLVAALKRQGSSMTVRDLRDYKPVWRAPVAIDFGEYRIYTMAPPSAGSLILGEALGILKHSDLVATGFQTPATVHLVSEALRRAYLDRNKYVGDPAFTKIPFTDLLNQKRLASLAASIDAERASTTAAIASTTALEREETTHFSIVDSFGNIAAVTTTLNGYFGSGVMAEGFFLNNEMDDFATKPGVPNIWGMVQSSANEVRPSARPASSMTPSIVMKDGAPYLVLGSPGGATIPSTILQVFLHVAVHGKTLAEAVYAPRYHQQDYPEEIQVERNNVDRGLTTKLNAMGHGIKERDDIGDVHAVMFIDGKLVAVADPRRGGSPGGF